jgi:hypothetical protein
MSKGKERKMKRLWLAGLALIVGALVVAGCGGSSGSSDGSTTKSGATTASGGGGPVEISDEDRQCLKEKGVELPEFKAGEGPQRFQQGEMPEPPEGGQMLENGEMPEGAVPEGGEMPEGAPPAGAAGAMSEENKEAFEECGVEMPEFKMGPGGAQAAGGGPNVNSAAFQKQVKEYAACVRENGYELAEPDFSGEGPIFDKSESESAAFKKASEQCQSLLGGPRTGGSEAEPGES